jgi:hypothetical protein
MSSGYQPERTIKYKTYVKTALVESFRDVFKDHVDQALRRVKVTIDFPKSEADYPCLIVRFFERDIKNAGIGHEEMITARTGDGSNMPDGQTFRFKHYFYNGDLEFAIYTLSSLDRDLISDTLVQTLGMADLESWTNHFLSRIYPDESRGKIPDAIWHYININTDLMQGFGETQSPTPWGSEDDLIYQTSYRIRTFGEFYSVPPNVPLEFIEEVLQYPYIQDVEEVPTGDPNDDGAWQPPIDFDTGNDSTETP